MSQGLQPPWNTTGKKKKKNPVLEVDDQHFLKVKHRHSMTEDFIFQEFYILLCTLFTERGRSFRVGRIDCCLYRRWVNRFCVSTEALPNQSTRLEEFVLSLGNKTRKHIYQTKPLSSRIERQRYNRQAHLTTMWKTRRNIGQCHVLVGMYCL